jgi:hypothetical protein
MPLDITPPPRFCLLSQPIAVRRDHLRALRWPSESYSDVIIRLAAYNAEEVSVIEVVQRGRDEPVTMEEIYLSLEQARDLGEIDDSTGARLPLQDPLRPLRRVWPPN